MGRTSSWMTHAFETRRRLAAAGAIVVIGASAAVGCGSSSGSTATSAASGGATQGSSSSSSGSGGSGGGAVGKINIGYVGDNVGAASSFGIGAQASAQLAVDQINHAGGLTVGGKKYMFNLDVCQDQGTNTGAQSCAVTLTRDHQDHLMYGALGPLAPIVQRVTSSSNALYLSGRPFPPNTALTVTTLGDTPWQVAGAIAAIKAYYPAAKRVTVLAQNDSVYQLVKPIISQQAAKAGLSVQDVAVPVGTTDYTTAMTQVKGTNPDVLVDIEESPAQGANVMRVNAELKAVPAVLAWGGDCKLEAPTNVSAPYIGYNLTSAVLDSPSSASEKQFLTALTASTKTKIPNLSSTLWFYDSFFLLKKAVEAAGSPSDVKAIYDNLFKVKVAPIGGGTYALDRATLSARNSFALCYAQGGKVIPSKFKTVTPTLPANQ